MDTDEDGWAELLTQARKELEAIGMDLDDRQPEIEAWAALRLTGIGDRASYDLLFARPERWQGVIDRALIDATSTAKIAAGILTVLANPAPNGGRNALRWAARAYAANALARLLD